MNKVKYLIFEMKEKQNHKETNLDNKNKEMTVRY